jgi:phosphohistidine phosphatase SixA
MSYVPDDLRGYVFRHSSTGMLKPEGWSNIPLTSKGRRQAEASSKALQAWVQNGWPSPDYIATSPVVRSKQTADIAASYLDVPVRPFPQLKAYAASLESKSRYLDRTKAILDALISDSGLPLIVAHRSTTAVLGQQYGLGSTDLDEGLLQPSGILGVSDNYLLPLRSPIPSAWSLEELAYAPGECTDAEDDIERPDPDDINPQPNEDRLRAIRAVTGGYESRRDLTVIDGYDESVRAAGGCTP